MKNEYSVANGNISEPNKPVKVNMVNSIECATNGDAFLPMERSESEEPIKPREFTVDLPNEIYVYRQDVVRCQKYDGLVGVVTEVAGDSDSDSSISDDDDDEDDDNDNDANNGGGVDTENGSGNNDNEGGSDKNDPLLDGQVRVIWLEHSETTNNISEITVVDRGFLHGDMVATVSDPTGQLGVVVDVRMSVDLRASDGAVIKDVSSRHLKRIRDFTVGDYVVSGPWLGRVDDVLDNVTVLFDDGSICKVMKVDPSRLKPVSKNILEDAHFPYHPGQRVRANSSSVFKNARWFSGVWKASRLEGTVMKVQAGSVFVFWIASANPGYGSESTGVPYEEQTPKNLTLLSCFVHANWQLGDWCLLPSPEPSFSAPMIEGLSSGKPKDPIKGCESHVQTSNVCFENGDKDTDMSCCSEGSGTSLHDPNLSFKDHLTINCGSIDLDRISNFDENGGNVETNASPKSGSCSSSLSVSKEPVQESWPIHRTKIRKVVLRRDRKARRRGETFEKALLIVNTTTKVNVVWQDGTREFGRDAKTLIPVNSPGDHEFCPEQYVVEKASNEVEDVSEVSRVGVVKNVNAKERTAGVRWLKPVARPEDPREFDNEEVMSVYELDDHPDYDYCIGDVVVRLSPVSMAPSAPSFRNSVQEQEQQLGPSQANGDKSGRKHVGRKKVGHTSKDQNDVNLSGLSWVGNITGLKDGDIEVTWADGMVSKVGPQAVYVVGRDDDDESLEGGNEVSDDDAASWETVDENEMDALENAEEDGDLHNASGNNSEMANSTSVDPEEENSVRSGLLSFPQAALELFTRVASSFFPRGRQQIEPLGSDSEVAQEPGLETLETSTGVAADNEFMSQESTTVEDACGLVLSSAAEVSSLEIIETLMPEESDACSMRTCYEGDSCSFKRFDIAKDPGDHYYLGGNGQVIVGGKNWVKKVQQEWNILEKNLPDGIYVRVYEDRMDLLRCVIVGAYGTPYQDGLFFFDFHLPPEYPQVPPVSKSQHTIILAACA
ncbi:ubiquitin-conjugating enzyme 23 isoform X2 [Tasmannia lanceolata]|uniref:ubiquitin-conjugating enzyme 23 isoform X2 n=1 Tax=Tasmannia lanceolata TaxID=3420 RepID=UPI00406368AD